MALRDHDPIVLEEFNGLWRRGDEDSCPIDHFPDCNNIKFIESGFETRPGLDTLIAKGNILRMYNYKMQNGESLIALDTNGDIYHSVPPWTSPTIHGPILHVDDMTDFGFVAIAGRAYISPFKTYTDNNGVEYQKGIENEFLYVYKGDGTQARKAAGDSPTNSDDTPLVAFNSPIDGLIDKGIHVIAVSFGDGIGGNSTGLGPSVPSVIYAPGAKEAIVNNLPIGGAGITQRFVYMTHAIDPKNWNPSGPFTFFLAKTISDNTTENTVISVADTDLVTPFAAGALPNPTSGGITAQNSATDGFCDLGLHIIGVVYETDTGYLTAPGPEVLAVQDFVNVNKAINIAGIPVSPDSFVTKRHLVASKAITNYNGNDDGYELFFIPDGTINNNTDTTKTVSFHDIDLVESASYLLDNFSEIPAGVTLTTYKGRLVLTTTFNDISVAYLSAPGEPEAIDQVDGILIMPLNGLPITNAQEFRDVLYTFKKTQTCAWNDNGDVPSTWQPIILDQGIGASIHGIAQVLDSGGINIEYLLVVYFGGIFLFNGAYAEIALTWKIDDLWFDLDRNDFKSIQMMNDTLGAQLYINLPDRQILYADYTNGLTPKDIKWSKWTFNIECTTIALIETNTLAIGSEQAA